MQHLTMQARMELFRAGSAAGDQRPGSVICLRSRNLLKEVSAYRHTQIVVILLVSETPRHSTTLHRRSGNIEPDGPKKLFGGRGTSDGLLLAVRVIEKPVPHRRAIDVKHFCGISAGLLKKSRNVFHWLEGVRAEALEEFLVLKQVAGIAAEHRQRTGFENDDVATFLEVGIQHGCGASSVFTRRGQQALGKSRTAFRNGLRDNDVHIHYVEKFKSS